MKKNNFYIPISGLIITLLSTSIAQSQDILWEKSFGGKQAEYLLDAIPTPDYGFILAGSSLSDKSGNKEAARKGNYDYCLWKISENGNIDWQKSFGGSKNDMLISTQATKDGGYILAGTSDSPMNFEKTDVAIGTINPTSKLTVAGNINSREVKVTVDAGADFVFEKNYALPSLQEVEKFVTENKHLPEIASAKEMQKEGIKLSEMNIKLLQKIEELTLYVIQQNKRIELLEKKKK